MLGLVSQKYCFLPPNAFLIDLLTKLSSLPFWNVSRIYFFLSTHSNLHHFSPNNLNILISLPAPSLIPESSIPYGPTRVIVLKHRPCPLLKNFPQRPITEREKSKIALMIWPQSVVFQSHLLPYFLCPLYCSLPNSFLEHYVFSPPSLSPQSGIICGTPIYPSELSPNVSPSVKASIAIHRK